MSLTAIRSTGEDAEWTYFEGVGIPFGGPFNGRDIYRTFADAKTTIDHSLASADGSHPLLYDHGMDAMIGFSRLGDVRVRSVDDHGEWVAGQIAKSNEYHDAIRQLMDEGALAISSGSHPTGPKFDKRNGHWERWVPVEYSLTPIEANPFAVISSVRSANRLLPDAEVRPVPLRSSDAASDAACGASILAQMLSVLGEESDEPDQAAVINDAITAWSRWLDMERAEIGGPDDEEADPMYLMSATIRPSIRAGARNSAADQAHIDAIHDHASALGATAHAGDDEPTTTDDSDNSDEPGPDAARSADRQPAPAVRQDVDIETLRSEFRAAARTTAASMLGRP